MSEMRRSRESIGTRLTPRARGTRFRAQRGMRPPVRAAETLAAALGVEARRVDLGALIRHHAWRDREESRRSCSPEAEAADAVLLFDEADALFGSRTDVKDSHDRYANIDTNVLLARPRGLSGSGAARDQQ